MLSTNQSDDFLLSLQIRNYVYLISLCIISYDNFVIMTSLLINHFCCHSLSYFSFSPWNNMLGVWYSGFDIEVSLIWQRHLPLYLTNWSIMSILWSTNYLDGRFNCFDLLRQDCQRLIFSMTTDPYYCICNAITFYLSVSHCRVTNQVK